MSLSEGKNCVKYSTCHSVRQNIFLTLLSIGITIPLGVKSCIIKYTFSLKPLTVTGIYSENLLITQCLT